MKRTYVMLNKARARLYNTSSYNQVTPSLREPKRYPYQVFAQIQWTPDIIRHFLIINDHKNATQILKLIFMSVFCHDTPASVLRKVSL